MTNEGGGLLAEYREVFLEELEEQLQVMDDEIMKLERGGNTERVIQDLFRAAHTLKGSSAAMGFETMKQLTHEMEHLLDQVRSRQVGVSGPLVNTLFGALDGLKQLKTDIVNGGQGDADIGAYVSSLQAITGGNGGNGVNGAGGDKAEDPPAAKRELSLDKRLQVQEARHQGLRVHWLRIVISESCQIKGARAYVIQSAISEWGEVLIGVPDPEELEESDGAPLAIDFLFAGTQNTEELQLLAENLIDVEAAQAQPVGEEETALAGAPAESTLAPAQEDAPQGGKSKSQTIRVSVERLEHLMNLVGELVIDQTRIHQVERMQRRRFEDETVGELGHIADHLSRVIGDLQESVMKARMLPIEQLFNRFPRMIRDLSRDLGKDIELVIEGKDTELDRTLIEEIADPLIHLIRNAVDHGIERPEVREQAGKPRQGKLRIRAAHEDNQVVIYVEDDGAGIHPENMRSAAVRKGLLTREEADALHDREAIDLIFRAGFSTASAVSAVSGRGVGMDIVRSHIEKLNGLIVIDTKPGEGTTFKIKLPLTLAIIVGLLVKLSERTFIVPMSNIAEIVRVTPDEIATVNGRSVILLRNQVIPVAWIHEHFGIPRTGRRRSRIPLVVIGSAEKRLALVVDDLIGNQEIVIKSLGSYIGKVDGIAGATILGDGSVALIMEAAGVIANLAEAAVRKPEA